MDYNPHLAPKDTEEETPAAGKGKIEKPDDVVNIVNQTRGASPTEWENSLGDALSEIFDADVVELPDVITKLNEKGVLDSSGTAWTEESFQTEMARLGA